MEPGDPVTGVLAPASPFGAGITFVTDLTGFMPGAGLATFDGGRIWAPVHLASPAPGLPAPTTARNVLFFNAYDGVMNATGDGWLATYRTTDGGHTWTPGAPLYDPSFPGGGWETPTFSDAQHGWVTDQTYIAATSDGGVSWHLVNVSSPNPADLTGIYGTSWRLGSLDFVSPSRGWLMFESHELATDDGGTIWRMQDSQYVGLGWADVTAPGGGGC